jgi:enolase
VLRAVAAVNDIIAPAITGDNPTDATDQAALDARLRELDGTSNKSNLGANAILGVSLAAAHASASALDMPLYRYLGGDDATTLPMPMVNIISGGRHAEGGLDMQDFLAIPIGADTYREALRMVVSVYRAVGRILTSTGPYGHGVADEGGYGPPLPCHEDALGLIHDAIQLAGYRCSRDGDIAIGLDVAATEFMDGDGRYVLRAERRTFSSVELSDLLHHWSATYPIISIEDGVGEDDWDGWAYLTDKLGARTQLIGDDLFTTNPQRLIRGADHGIANAILIKPNQIGTLTETLETVRLARERGYLPVISARSGETEDTTIADLAVATGAGQVKIGSITRSERLAKYNQLLRIEEELGDRALFAGRNVFARFLAA